MAERTAEDVKLRPLAGDVLRKRNVDYTVRAPEMCFAITARRLGRNGVRVEGYGNQDDWIKWAAVAEVIHIAQPKEKTDGEQTKGN